VRLKARLARLELAFKTRNAEHFLEVCLCFPADEQPWFRWRVEADEAAKVLCPLHGRRFQTVVRHHLYQALHFYVADFDHGWPGWSIQYQKAMTRKLKMLVPPISPSHRSRLGGTVAISSGTVGDIVQTLAICRFLPFNGRVAPP
jgi:hypothetical protein